MMNPHMEQPAADAGRAILELRDVAKSYGEGNTRVGVLHGVTARFEPGEHVVIIGRSGSGKSTLLNLLGALDVPTEGDVLFAGRSLAAMTETERAMLRRARLGFVFQAFNLVPTLTVRENLLVPLQLNGIAGRAAELRCAALLDDAGLGHCGPRFPDQLSGGEQQRVAVLRAIIHEPTVVIADEPTGNLDIDTARATLDLLERFTAAGGRTLIMATHSREVMGRASRVLSVSGGHLREFDDGVPVP
jgi:putative ABC transport system ATP-binding protein